MKRYSKIVTLALKPPELGLVCITVSDQVRFRTITRKRLLQFTEAEQVQILRQLYAENIRRLAGAIEFCQTAQIRLYRLSSATFPFADEPLGKAVLAEFAAELSSLGRRATATGLRLVLHPDQFVVLNSDRPEVIANSIKILTAHAELFDSLGLPRSPWALMNIHGGKGDRAERLIQVIQELPDAIRLRLTLENDERTYGVSDLLPICAATGVPLVFDAHHHLIQAQLDSYDHPSVAAALAAAGQTWQRPDSQLDWQLVHISNGREFLHDPRHSEYIEQMPAAYAQVPWIEIEARQKENAIARLQIEWLPSLGHPSSSASAISIPAASSSQAICLNV